MLLEYYFFIFWNKHTRHIYQIQVVVICHFFICSLAVHPNKLLIATGQATGHDRREGRVSYQILLQFPVLTKIYVLHN